MAEDGLDLAFRSLDHAVSDANLTRRQLERASERRASPTAVTELELAVTSANERVTLQHSEV